MSRTVPGANPRASRNLLGTTIRPPASMVVSTPLMVPSPCHSGARGMPCTPRGSWGDLGLDPPHGAQPPLAVARPPLLEGGHLGMGQHEEPLLGQSLDHGGGHVL